MGAVAACFGERKALPKCGPSDAAGEELSVFAAGFSCKHGAHQQSLPF